MMERRGFSPDQGPTAVMRAEHVEGRSHIAVMDGATEDAGGGDAKACSRFVEHARRYVHLLREHIQKEDHCLFPMADEALTDDDQEELARRFERVEHDEIGGGVHERYVRMADELARRWQVEPTAAAGECGGCGCGSHA